MYFYYAIYLFFTMYYLFCAKGTLKNGSLLFLILLFEFSYWLCGMLCVSVHYICSLFLLTKLLFRRLWYKRLFWSFLPIKSWSKFLCMSGLWKNIFLYLLLLYLIMCFWIFSWDACWIYFDVKWDTCDMIKNLYLRISPCS